MSVVLLGNNPKKLFKGALGIYHPYKDVLGRNISSITPSTGAMTLSVNTYYESATTASHYVSLVSSVSLVIVQVKITPVGRRRFLLGNGANSGWVLFDTTSCSVIANGAGASNYSIVNNQDGTYTLTSTLNIGSTTDYFLYSMPDDAINNTSRSFAGDITKGFIINSRQVNFGNTLFPYIAPTGLPQSLTDYSGRGNHAQLGSTTGADTNDPTWGDKYLSYGADDYSRTPIDITKEATLISVVNIPDLSVSRGIIGNRGGSNYRSYIICNITSGTLNYGVAASIGQYSGLSMVAGETACLMMRYRNGYVDGFKGIAKSNLLTYDPTWSVASTWDLGQAATSSYNGGNGYFYAIFPRALSDGEYLRHYNYLKNLFASKGVTI